MLFVLILFAVALVSVAAYAVYLLSELDVSRLGKAMADDAFLTEAARAQGFREQSEAKSRLVLQVRQELTQARQDAKKGRSFADEQGQALTTARLQRRELAARLLKFASTIADEVEL